MLRRIAAVTLGAAVAVAAFLVISGTVYAHSGTVVASENCQSWSATVSLHNNVTIDRKVVVVTTIPGTTGLTGHFSTVGNSGDTVIWTATGVSPATGTVTLNIFHGKKLEFTANGSISPPEGCTTPPTPTPVPTATPSPVPTGLASPPPTPANVPIPLTGAA